MIARLTSALWMFWFCLPIGNAQQNNAGIVQGAIPPSICLKADTLNELAFQSNNPKEIEQFARQALNLALKANCLKGQADAHFRIGRAKAILADFASAKRYYTHGIALRKQSGDSLSIANGYITLGQLYKNQNKFDSAKFCYQNALVFIQNKPVLSLAYLFNSLGTLYDKTNDFSLTRVYYRRGLAVYAKLLSSPSENLQDIQLGRAVLRMNFASLIQDHYNQRKAAKDSLLKSLNDFEYLKTEEYLPLCRLFLGNNAYYQNDLELAQTYYQQAIADTVLLDPLYRARIFKNLGRVYLDQGKYPLAKKNFGLSRKILAPLNDSTELVLLQFEFGNYYYEQGDYPNAVQNYLQVLDFQTKDTLLVGRTLFFLSDAYQELKQPGKAKRYEDQLIRLLNNLNSDQGNLAFQELFRYQMDKQSLLKQCLQNQKALIYQRSLTWGAVLLGLLLLAIGGIYLFRQWQLAAIREAKIAQQNEEIALNNKNLALQEAELARKKEQVAIQQNLALLRQKELETQYARLEAQDLIQQKIGEELHDGVGSMLATVKMNLLTVEEVLDRLPTERIATYNQANRLLDEACDKVRKLSHEFGEALLKQFGLKAQLEALLEAIGTSKIAVELVTHGLNQRQDFQLELNLYRIIQELVHNVIKHAQATQISIQVSYFPENVNVVIDDNGRGFDVQSIQDSPGLGMLSIQSRVNEHAGHIHFDSRPGRGTTVMIDIPL